MGVQTQKEEFQLILNPSPEIFPPILTREGIDTLNSICWLLMDAFWMFGLPKIGLILGIPTFITALMLLQRERRSTGVWINLSTICWIGMNVFWMLSDTYSAYEQAYLNGSKITLLIGVILVTIGAYRNGNLMNVVAHYKRYKSLGGKKVRIVR